MTMLSKENKSISQVLFVISYERDLTIRTKQFDIENFFTPLITGASVNTNLPDDFNPQAPRVTLKKDRLAVNFSQLTAQLTIDIDNANKKSLTIIQSSIDKQINLFQACVDKIIPRDKQRERGLILTIFYSLDPVKYSDRAVFDYIQSNFFKIPPLGEPASAQFNVGYKTNDNFFITLAVTQYKVAGGKISTRQGIELLDLTSLPIIDSGIELKVDINSRPLVGANEEQIDDVTAVIVQKTFDFITNDADKFMGVENE